jgi:hypothetical protein
MMMIIGIVMLIMVAVRIAQKYCVLLGRGSAISKIILKLETSADIRSYK